ncbi:hypothetical protein AGDE_09114 [Angomonas deanei]|uniref:HEAT repeat-containing protein 1 n=1 Tax=Angomonas deanei TaxID=59799 RepID=A0A7G2CN42_9TRYP|nr:hypothetical protein AGDE_09114 [Angomonas deanei]CAD2221256.1 hypothetical protein, conserved [Angomonas deanei]|eukprot:EPY31313.1 hypothetical protein AGDE_09114 [Angomonas deanei]
MSSLATQLKKLQQRSTDSKHLSDSFLFNKSDAKSFSREQIWQLASAGLSTLVTLDGAFQPFLDDLFDVKKARQERKLMTTDETNKLNLRLDHFLTLLSPHLFLTAAQQVFEYLVRVYEVHVYNVTAVLRAFLPYHDHNIFSRAMLLLDLRDTGLDFLSKNQERGAPLLRDHLIIAAGDSREVLRLVCDTALLPHRLNISNNAANALLASVASRLATHVEADSLWRTLLPYLMELMNGADTSMISATSLRDDTVRFNGISPTKKEGACTALVVLAAWSTEVQFSLKTVLAVVKPLMVFLQQTQDPSMAVAPLTDLLGMLDLLFRTQREVVSHVSFTQQLNVLCTLPWSSWAPLLEAQFSSINPTSSSAIVPYNALFSTLVLFCLERLKVAGSFASISGDITQLLQVAATALPLSQTVVQEFLKVLMTAEDKFQEGKDASGRFFETVVSALERRYQSVFDTTLSTLLREDGAHTSSFLSRHLSGTRYQMVSVPGARGAKEQLPLFACLIHTNVEIRRVAALSMREMTLEQFVSSGRKGGAAITVDGGSLLELLANVLSYESSSKVAKELALTALHALELLTKAVKELKDSQAATLTRYQHYFRLLLDALLRVSFLQTETDFLSFFYTEVLTPLLSTVESKPSSQKSKKGAAAAVASASDLTPTLFFHIVVVYVALATSSKTEKNTSKVVSDITALLQQNFSNAPLIDRLVQDRKPEPQSSTIEDDDDDDRYPSTKTKLQERTVPLRTFDDERKTRRTTTGTSGR